MSFVNNIKPSAHSACNLFAPPVLSNSIAGGYFTTIRPTTSIEADDSPVEFFVAPTSEYIDLSLTRLKIKAKILLENGEPIPENSKVTVVNNVAHSIFASIHIELSNTPITQSSGHYAYRSMLERILNYGSDGIKHLRTSLFIKDTAGAMDGSETNLGYVARRTVTKDAFEIESPFASDIFNQQRFLLSHVPMLIRLYRSKPEFVLMSDASDKNKYKIQILEAILTIRRVKVSNAIAIAHNVTLNTSGPALYPINRTEIRSFVISKDLSAKSLDNIFIGQLPFRVTIAMIDQESFIGNLSLNPFNFQTFNYSSIKLKTDSNIQIDEIRTDFSGGNYIEAYNSMLINLGVRYYDCGNTIDYDSYSKGYAILVFDLTDDLSAASNYWNVPKSGLFGCEIEFKQPLNKPIVLLVMAEFNSLIEINHKREVSSDYRR